MRIFVPVGAAAGSASLSREFIKYRCVPEREDVKRAVEKIGQTNLKKWFAKAS
jgi:origin recognition complex subunit 4